MKDLKLKDFLGLVGYKIMSLKEYSLEELQKEIERREIGLPEIIEFKMYLHTNYNRREIEDYIESQTGYLLPDELITVVVNAFYEVGFPCVLNTKTGKLNTEVKFESG